MSPSTSTSKKLKKVFPWISSKEWKNVYADVYSEDCDLRSKACDFISVWRSRTEIPGAVECTVILNQALSEVEQSVTSDHHRSESELQLLLSMALVRFVNVVVDTQNARTKMEQPIYICCAKMGVPEWLVDLRHNAAHYTLPALNTLKFGVEFALSWLKGWYWETKSRQVNQMANITNRNPGQAFVRRRVIDSARATLIDYQGKQYNQMEEGRFTDESAREVGLVQIKEKLCDLARSHSSVLIETLILDGFLIPTEEQLGALRIDRSDICNDEYSLPEALLRFWKPLLHLLHQLSFTPLLVQELLTSLNSDHVSLLRRRLVLIWVSRILNDCCWKGLPSSVRQIHLYKPSSNNKQGNWRPILHLVLKHVCPVTPHILQCLFKLIKPALSKKKRAALLQLVNIQCQSGSSVKNTGEKVEAIVLSGSEPEEGDISDNENKINQWPNDEKKISESCIFTIQDLTALLDTHSSSVVSDKAANIATCSQSKQLTKHCRNSHWEIHKENVNWTKYAYGGIAPNLSQGTSLHLQSSSFLRCNVPSQRGMKRKGITEQLETKIRKTISKTCSLQRSSNEAHCSTDTFQPNDFVDSDCMILSGSSCALTSDSELEPVDSNISITTVLAQEGSDRKQPALY